MLFVTLSPVFSPLSLTTLISRLFVTLALAALSLIRCLILQLPTIRFISSVLSILSLARSCLRIFLSLLSRRLILYRMTDGAWIRLVNLFLDTKRQLIAELLRREGLKSMEEYARKFPASFKGFFMDDIFFT